MASRDRRSRRGRGARHAAAGGALSPAAGAERGEKLLKGAAIAALATIIALGATAAVAWRAASGGARDEIARVRERLPRRTAHPAPAIAPSAVAAEALSARATWGADSTPANSPSPAHVEAWRWSWWAREPGEQAAFAWLAEQLEREEEAIAPPADDARAWIAATTPDDAEPDVSRAIGLRLTHALLLQHDGETPAAVGHLDAAARLTEDWLARATFAEPERARARLVHVLRVARKVPVPASWSERFPPSAIRESSAQALERSAAELLALAEEGSANQVLATWSVDDTSAVRRMALPWYRKRLAQAADALLDRAAIVRAGGVREAAGSSDVPSIEAPLEDAPRLVRAALSTVALNDLTDWDYGRLRPWRMAPARELELGLVDAEAELTRAVVLMRARRDGDPAHAWPLDPPTPTIPRVRFDASRPAPGGLRLAVRPADPMRTPSLPLPSFSAK